jgi:hypothetical protein
VWSFFTYKYPTSHFFANFLIKEAIDESPIYLRKEADDEYVFLSSEFVDTLLPSQFSTELEQFERTFL